MFNKHIHIENISPSVDGGKYPIKGIEGEAVSIEADIYRDGFDCITAEIHWKKKADKDFQVAPLKFINNDRWSGQFIPLSMGHYTFSIASWTHTYETWLMGFQKKVEANQDISTDAIEGAILIDNAHLLANQKETSFLGKAAQILRDQIHNGPKALECAAQTKIREIMTRLQSKRDLVESIELELIVERKKAAFGSWYEMFVRSQSKTPGQHSTFREAEHRLPDIKAMGFDVLYLAPIYPIGISGRKGKDNSLICRPEDPGCPWAVGSDAGGHTAVEPLLGTLTDFDHFQKEAGKNGLEIALDFAVQCSPDHPWVKKHPEWFFQRPDGSVKFAENPPMKYEDICQINFDCPTWESLWRELRDSILFWIKRGVKIFRVDNPHTKAFTFWEWLIKEIRSDYPDVIFLSEALTRPKPMKLLSKLGFSQSYTYFIWRNSKHEVMEYLSELSQSPMKDYFRPNLFVNTPDNIHPYLQNGGQPAFKIRLALAGTLSPSYGIYSGYELCENEAIPGTEEYKNSEKFEISPRDWNKPGHIKDYIAKINAIRKENSALHHIGNLHFFDIQNDQMVAFGKIETDFSNIILVVANLDPFHAQAGNLRLSLDKLGLPWSGKVELRDLITGQNYVWGEHNFVSLDPYHEPVHILKVERRYS